MATLQYIISGALTLIVYGMVLFGVYRIFMISTDVSEIKTLLRDIKRNTGISPTASYANSPEALVRAVHAASYSDLEEQSLQDPPR